MALDPEFESSIRARLSSSSFASWMGLRIVSIDDGSSEIAIDLAPHHLNPGGIVHGGIVATILDAAIGLALRTTIGMRSHVTVQLDVHYLAPASEGALFARGKAVHTGKRIGYGEGEAFDRAGRVVAKGAATFLVKGGDLEPSGD